MTDVFISYSRKDKAFVQQLFQALRDNKRDVWVDWEDIPLASEWLTEIS
jgi:TIR domain